MNTFDVVMSIGSKRSFDLKTMLQAGVIALVVIIVVLSGFISPYAPDKQSRQEPNAPPSVIRFTDEQGKFYLRPFIYVRRLEDPLTFRFEEDHAERFPVAFFVRGDQYMILGLIPVSIHLFGVESNGATDAPRINLLGTDALGRDRFSRLLRAFGFSVAVCLLGTILASLIGISIGFLSGYSNRTVDTILMGVADTFLALPTLILILAARAAFPPELPPLRAAALLVMIFALVGWAEMARLARGLVRSAREQEYVTAARSVGRTEQAIMFRHIWPNVAPTLITQATVMLPYFLLAEVALSFLGVGLQEPAPSLGNMLAAANDLGQLQRSPFLLLSPAVVIFLFVFLIRFLTTSFRSDEEHTNDSNWSTQ